MGKPGPKAHPVINDLLKNAKGKSSPLTKNKKGTVEVGQGKFGEPFKKGKMYKAY